MGALDIAARGLLQAAPREVAQWLLGRDARVLAAKPEESQHIARERRLDKLLRVRLAGQRRHLRLHVEVAARWASDVPRRTHEAWTLCGGTEGPTLSVVLVLKPDPRRRRMPEERLVVDALGLPVLEFRFRVLRLWTIEADRLLRGGPEVLLPFLPYTLGASSSGVQQAFHRLESIDRPGLRGELLSTLAVFASDVFPGIDWLGMIPEELRMEKKNRVIETWLAEARQLELSETVAGMLRSRLGKRATALVRRSHAAPLQKLRKASRLIANTRDDEELIALLTALLEPAKPGRKALARS